MGRKNGPDEKIIIKPKLEKSHDDAIKEDDEEVDLIDGKVRKKIKDEFKERKKIKKEEEEKIIIKPKKGAPVRENEKDDEEDSNDGEEEEAIVKTKKKMSWNDLKSTAKIKISLEPQNATPKRKKKHPVSEEHSTELSFDGIPGLDGGNDVKERNRINDQFSEREKTQQVEEEKLIIKPLPELLSQRNENLDSVNGEKNGKKKISDEFEEKKKKKRRILKKKKKKKKKKS